MKYLGIAALVLVALWVTLKIVGVLLGLLPLLVFAGGIAGIGYVAFRAYTYAKEEELI